MLEPEPLAEPAKSADDLINDQQDVVLPADGLHAFPVPPGRDDYPACALYGLADKCSHVLGPDLQYTILDLLGAARGECVFILAEALPEFVGLRHVFDARDRQAADGMHLFHAAKACPRHGRAVIGVPARDEYRARGLSVDMPVMAHHAHHGVVRLRARRVEEHVLQVPAQQLREPGRQHHSGRRRRLEEGVVERQLAHLLASRLSQFLASIAHVHAPKACHAVQQRVAIAIPHGAAIGTCYDPAAAERDNLAIVRLRRQVMLHIKASQFRALVVAAGHLFSLVSRQAARCAERARAAGRITAIADSRSLSTPGAIAPRARGLHSRWPRPPRSPRPALLLPP